MCSYSNLTLGEVDGGSRLFPINFSPILKHTGVKPSLVPRLYHCTQTNCNVKCDAVWQTVSGRSGSQMRSARRQMPSDGVCQMPRLPDSVTVWQTPCLADAVWQMPSARRRLPQTASGCQTYQTPSARRCLVLRCNWSEYVGKAWERG